MAAIYTNRQLFSDHWLRERLPERPEFQAMPLALVRFALWARTLADTVEVEHGDVSDTALQIVTPGLAALGYRISGDWTQAQSGLWSAAPDLFWQLAGIPGIGDDARASVLVGVCPGDAPLDAIRGGDTPGPQRAPSITFLRLLATSEAVWGILTNGRVWRLYHRDGGPLEAYYEVDLVALGARRDVDALKYAYLFFGAQAHHAEGIGEASFLERALAESRAYAAGIEDDLRVRAFDAISAACQALADALAAERGISAAMLAQDDLRAVYADALALLYRLLFVLYAESRELLPASEERYAARFGLRALIAQLPTTLDALDQAGNGARSASVLPPGLWARLVRLFRALDGGEGSPNPVPAFSGSLFESDAHPLLARLALDDRQLARMLILLGRTKDGRQIDFADLAVRQLGSIYEGLLEHQRIAVALEEMALAKGAKDKAPVIVSAAEPARQGRRILERYAPGTVYLSNDKGERHAFGTYYTPEPVVRYLVEETLGPLVADKTADRIMRLRVLDPAMGSGHFLVATVDYLARAALAAQDGDDTRRRGDRGRSRVVGTVRDDEADDDLSGGVLDLKRRIAEQCIYGVDINESAVELAKLSLWLATAARDRPLTFLDLHLRTGNSLIGLGPGEIETAARAIPVGASTRTNRRPKRASTTSVGASGTASVGASGTASVGASGGRLETQAALWNETAFAQDMFRLVGGARVIDMMPTASVGDVRTKEHLLRTLEPWRDPYRRAADLAVSLRFGNRVSGELYAAAVKQELGQSVARLPDATLRPVLEEARRVREQQHVFHWELEFPEVFRDADGQPLGASAGFDAILGNPPYVSVTTLRAADPEAWAYFPQVYTATTRGQWDLYEAFVERALALLSGRGRMAYILPNKWLTTDFGALLRALLADRRAVTALVDFGAYPVFPGVSNYTCLLFAGRQPRERIAVLQRTDPEGDVDLPPRPDRGSPWIGGSVEASTLGEGQWNLTVGSAQAIMQRWADWPTVKGHGTVFEGVTTGANPVFILAERSRGDDGTVICFAPALGREVRLEAALLRPVLQGRDIQPYACDDGGARLLFPYAVAAGRAELLPAATLEAEYPLTWAYLNDPAIRAILEAREKGRFKGKATWYGFGRPQNLQSMGVAKLVLPDVADRGRVAYDAAGRAIVDTAYGIVAREGSPYAPHFVLAALNSPVLTFFLRHRGTDLRGGYFRMKTAYLNPFPLPPIAWGAAGAERGAQAAWGTEQALRAIHEGRAAREVTTALAHLPGVVLHDVVAALAEHAGALGERMAAAWRGVAAAVALHAPAQASDERVAGLLAVRPAAAAESPDALLAAITTAQGPALAVPSLGAIRTAYREARASITGAGRERGAVVALLDALILRLYQVADDEIGIIAGQELSQAAEDGVRLQGRGQGRRRSAAPGDDERSLAQEVEREMRTITKGGQPEQIVTCLRQALADPYSDTADMNTAMGYVAHSTTGPHYLALAWLAGLLDDLPSGLLRPTPPGRAVVARARDDGEALWQPLLALPAYRRYLESRLLEMWTSASERSVALGAQVAGTWRTRFPEFASRAASILRALGIEGQPAAQVRRLLSSIPPLEPVADSALRDLALAQGFSGGQSDLTRAERIAEALGDTAAEPLHVDAAWLDATETQALLLLAAAREHGRGCVIAGEEPTTIALAVEALRHGGIDIRVERRGRAQVATLVPAVALVARDATTLEAEPESARRFELRYPLLVSDAGEDAVTAVLRETVRGNLWAGADGIERAALGLDEIAEVLASAELEGVGQLVGTAAAEEIGEARSTLRIGPPLPLPSDLPRLDRPYRFFDNAQRVARQAERAGVAILLSDWLLERDGQPEELLAIHPHLALLYLIAADTGDQSESLRRRADGWECGGRPLVAALDERLRGLGYEVWDERYRGREALLHELGNRLIEQGLRRGVLENSGSTSAALEAPARFGYYEAYDLLLATAARGGVR